MLNTLDKTDREIMLILQKDARIANTEIAKRLGISEGTVRNRIRKLVDNRVIQNIAVINPELLGYQVHLIIGIQVDYKKINEVASALRDKEAVHFLGYSTGRYDLMIICFFRTVEDHRQFLLKELATIDGIVRTETLNILKMLKTKYLWGLSLPESSELFK